MPPRAPAGRSLEIRRSDSGTRIRDYTAERVLTYSANAAGLEGGDILVCTEYGRVEIMDPGDDELRLQVRMEGFGEGSDEPGRAATRVIDEPTIHVFYERAPRPHDDQRVALDPRLHLAGWTACFGKCAPAATSPWCLPRADRGFFTVSSLCVA